MKTSKISYRNTNRFNQLVLDYLDQKAELSQFVTSFPNIGEFKNQIERKKRDGVDRLLLFDVLKSQNKNITLSKKSTNNLTSLKEGNTFTITTGHQLCLFTGPLYFIYKIISTINLASELSVKYPENNFVPIFWLASEDHDFDEISSINIYNKKINWERESTGGPVGRMGITGIDSLIKELTNLISKNPKSSKIIDLLNKSYSSNKNLTEATRYLINSLFAKLAFNPRPPYSILVSCIETENDISLFSNETFNSLKKLIKLGYVSSLKTIKPKSTGIVLILFLMS